MNKGKYGEYAMFAVIALIIGVAGVLITSENNSDGQAVQPPQTTATEKSSATTLQGKTQAEVGEYVAIPLSEISANLRKYTYSDGGKQIRYLVVLGSDGAPRTALDGCVVCGGAKGYRQQGDDVVCNNCGLHFKIDDLGSLNSGSGCWPIQLEHTVSDGKILIAKKDLIAGEYLF